MTAGGSKPRRIPSQCGTAFTIRRGQVLRVIDPQGEQVSDLFACAENRRSCWLSGGRSLDYAGRLYLSTGDILYSNDSKPMFTIVDDTVGMHDFMLTPCSQEMFEILYKYEGHHPSCLENLSTSLAEFGIGGEQIHNTFNIFMNVTVDSRGKVTVGIPNSKAGDHIDLRAEMDMICGLTACSAEGSNNGCFKPIDFMILGEAQLTPHALQDEPHRDR